MELLQINVLASTCVEKVTSQALEYEQAVPL